MRTSTGAARLHGPCPPRPSGTEQIRYLDLVERVHDALREDRTVRQRRSVLKHLLAARDADGRRILPHATTHRDTVDAVMSAIFASPRLALDDKQALMVWSLQFIGRELCEATALLDAITNGVNRLPTEDAARLYLGLRALLPFVVPCETLPRRTHFEAVLDSGRMATCRKMMFELLVCAGPEVLGCCLDRRTGRALGHRLLAHDTTAPLFLHLVLALPNAVTDWRAALGRLLFARTRAGSTPLWTADIAAPGVADAITSVLQFILTTPDLCNEGRRRLLIGFASPPSHADDVRWKWIRRTYARAFELPELDRPGGARDVELAILRHFQRLGRALEPDWTRKAVAEVVAQHPLPPAMASALLRRLDRALHRLQTNA